MSCLANNRFKVRSQKQINCDKKGMSTSAHRHPPPYKQTYTHTNTYIPNSYKPQYKSLLTGRGNKVKNKGFVTVKGDRTSGQSLTSKMLTQDPNDYFNQFCLHFIFVEIFTIQNLANRGLLKAEQGSSGYSYWSILMKIRSVTFLSDENCFRCTRWQFKNALNTLWTEMIKK